MDDMVALRCKYCGAPLDEAQIKSDSPYVTCQSCGTTQQRMDAQEYLNQLMGQVQSWLSSAIPMGFNIAGAENVDPVARHSIFTKAVRPKIELEMNEFKFSNLSLLGNCLLIMPFSDASICKPAHTAAKAFEFNAKVKSVSALAVDDESKDVINDASSLSQSYALMINNTELLCKDKEGRYILMANNFTASAEALKASKGKEVVAARFTALADVCNGIDKLLSGNLVDSEAMIRKGRDALVPVKDQAMASMEYGIMVQGITQEIAICDALLNVIESTKTAGGDPLATIAGLIKVVTVKLPSHPKWGYVFNDSGRMGEVMNSMNAALKAKNDGTIPVAAGGGKLLVPFWRIDLRYSFETGALWKKKSVEVDDMLFAIADFVVDERCLNNPELAVTDIFSDRPKNGRFAGIKGEETSISNGSGLKAIADSVSDQSAGGREIVMPMSTMKEAEKLCGEYLAKVSSKDKKFKLSKPVVKGLIYIPCTVNGNKIICEPLDTMVPERMKNIDAGTVIKS